MPLIQSVPGRGRYLISSMSTEKLSAFLSEISAHPELQLLDKLGPSEAPHTAVLEMPHTQAAQLQQRFAALGELNIEPDQRLKMFADPAASP